MRIVKHSSKESSKLTVRAVSIFWQQARLPLHEFHKCSDKLLKLYEKWNSPRKNEKNPKRNEFSETIDDLFDIAHADALNIMRIEDDNQFLIKQREKGRPGCMIGVYVGFILHRLRT